MDDAVIGPEQLSYGSHMRSSTFTLGYLSKMLPTRDKSLRRELVDHPVILAFGTLAQSIFTCSTFFGSINWPSVSLSELVIVHSV